SAALIVVQADIHKSDDAGEIQVNAFLLIQIILHRSVFACELLETLLASRVRKASHIENEASTVSTFILRGALMKRKAENPDSRVLGFGVEFLQHLRGEHLLKCMDQRWRCDGQFHIVKQPAQVFQREWDALQEMRFAFKEASKSIRAQCLHDADIDIRI